MIVGGCPNHVVKVLCSISLAVAMIGLVPSAETAALETAHVRNARSADTVQAGRNRGRPQPSDEDSEYGWICPTVVCRPLPDECELVEYIVLDYAYLIRGRVVNVRCQSCPYCLDGPFWGGARRKRSLYDMIGWTAASSGCPPIQCPATPDNCTDLRPTDVILRGRRCDQCPACYDDTVVDNYVTL